MKIAFIILCIIFGVLGIVSLIFTLYTEKQRKQKAENLKKSLERKRCIIESLEQENSFLKTLARYNERKIDEIIT